MEDRAWTRRHFLVAAAASVAGTKSVAGAPLSPSQTICAFTKGFEHVSYEKMAKLIAEAGFHGIEGTIRPGGQVEPDRVEEDLPKLVQALEAQKLELTIMASGVNEVTPLTEKVLRTAVSLGVERYRMAYYRYDLKKEIPPQLADFAAKMKDVVEMNRDLGIQGLYQNHSGAKYFGTAVWDLYEVIKSYPAKAMAVAFDIGHATVEGGTNWPLQARLIRPFAGALYVKDYVWKEPQKRISCPLGEGIIDGRKCFKEWFAQPFAGPLSLHVEYHNHKDPKVVPELAKSYKQDLETLTNWLA